MENSFEIRFLKKSILVAIVGSKIQFFLKIEFIIITNF
jgi:hypothetical protein